MAETHNSAGMNVCNACWCCNNLISLNIMEFIGCSGHTECLCIQEEFCITISKPAMPCVVGPADGLICKLGVPCCSIGLKMPTLCAKGHGRCFCFVNNLALPPDSETPMMFAMYGLMCFPTVGCCIPVSQSP